MASITAAMVKELRERTGLGMMDCKKAMVAADGNIEKAIDALRKSGQAKAAKKSGRIAAEGVVSIKVSKDNSFGILVEINSETDFVARDENFLKYVEEVVNAAFDSRENVISKLMVGGLEDARLALIQKVGENINVRRISLVEAGVVGGYVHGNNRIGVLVGQDGGDVELAHDVAIHVAAINPQVISQEDMPAELLENEKQIFMAQAKQSGKPAEIIDKMVAGRVNKFLSENSLLEQPFVKDPDIKIGALAKNGGATITAFTRFEVGDGIEKVEVDFATEVRAQAGL